MRLRVIGHNNNSVKKKTSNPRRKFINREGAKLVKNNWSNLHVRAGVLSGYFGIPIAADDLQDQAEEKRLTELLGEAIKADLESKDTRAYRKAFLMALDITGYAPGKGHGGQMGYWSRSIRGRKDESELSPYPGMGKGSSLDQIQQFFDLINRTDKTKIDIQKPPVQKAILALGNISGKAATQPLKAPAENISNPTDAQLIAVEIDGELVEMNRKAYEIYKDQREALLKLKDQPLALGRETADRPNEN